MYTAQVHSYRAMLSIIYFCCCYLLFNATLCSPWRRLLLLAYQWTLLIECLHIGALSLFIPLSYFLIVYHQKLSHTFKSLIS